MGVICKQWGLILSIDNSDWAGKDRVWLNGYRCGCPTAGATLSNGAISTKASSAPAAVGTACSAACPNLPGLEWEEALVRHGDWTREAVVRLGGRRLWEWAGRMVGVKESAAVQGVKFRSSSRNWLRTPAAVWQ